MSSVTPRGSYGVDAPWVPWMWVGYAIIYGTLTVVAAVLWHAWPLAVAVLALVAVLSATPPNTVKT